MTRNRLIFFGPTGLLGVVGLLLRRYMLATGLDDKGLLIRGYWANTALWVLAVGFLAIMWVLSRKLDDRGGFPRNFPRCKLSGSLAMAGGAVMLVQVVLGRVCAGFPGMLFGILGAAAMIFTGFCRFRGLHPMFLAHGAVSILYLLVLIGNYQSWSADPQLYEYGFQILACLMLMVCAYLRTCCDASRICRRDLVFFGMGASFFCLISLSDLAAPGFYLAGGLWAAVSMCTVEPIGK